MIDGKWRIQNQERIIKKIFWCIKKGIQGRCVFYKSNLCLCYHSNEGLACRKYHPVRSPRDNQGDLGPSTYTFPNLHKILLFIIIYFFVVNLRL